MNHNSDLKRLLTADRLRPYLDETGHDLDDAMRLYFWNRDLSVALFADIALVEVAFRNAIDASLRTAFQSSHWYWDNQRNDYSQRLESKTIRKLKRVHKDLTPDDRGSTRDAPAPITELSAGKIVSQLMLGFWVELLEGPSDKTLWLPDWTDQQGTGIAHGLAGLVRLQRRPVYSRASLMQQTRNRIAHHEPIFKGVRRKGGQHRVPIEAVHTEISELAAMIHPAIGQQLLNDSQSGAILTARP